MAAFRVLTVEARGFLFTLHLCVAYNTRLPAAVPSRLHVRPYAVRRLGADQVFEILPCAIIRELVVMVSGIVDKVAMKTDVLNA